MAIIPQSKDDSAPAITAALVRDPVCAVLRKAREQAGYDIVDIAQLLRIQRNYLEAIEEGRYSDLPGTVYAIGFIRTYSDFLNLDATDMVRRFKEEASELSNRADYVFPVPPAEARVPRFGILVIGVLLAALAYGAWFVSTDDEGGLVDRVSEIPDRFAELASRAGGSAQTDADAPNAQSPADPQNTAGLPVEPPPAADASVTPPDLDALAEMAAAREPRPTDQSVAVEPVAPDGVSREPVRRTVEPPSETVTPAVTIEPAVIEAPTVAEPAVVVEAPAETTAPADPATPARAPERGIEPIETIRTVEPIRRVPPSTVETNSARQLAAVEQPPTSSAGLPKAATGPSDGQPGPATSGSNTAMSAPTNILPSGQPTRAEAPPSPPPVMQQDQRRRNGLGNLSSRILIRATEMSWVQITDDLGNLVMTRVLDPGESYRVPNTDGLTLASGNAGGLEVLVDGVVQAPLGLRGTVVRNVALDPDNFGTRRTN